MSARPLREFDVVVGDETVVALVRESARTRRLRLVVPPKGPIELTVPRRTSMRALQRFLDDNADWLEQKLVAAREAAARRPVLGLAQAGTAWLAGERLTVVHSGGVKSVVHRKDAVLRVSGPAEAADEAIDRWYRREARTRLEEAVARHAEQLGIQYGRVTIRDQRTRWGSCSTRGTLSFSWRLVLAPPEVLEYVVVHELLHVREANHSRAFWHLLDVHRPGWKAQAQWLRTHGHELLAY